MAKFPEGAFDPSASDPPWTRLATISEHLDAGEAVPPFLARWLSEAITHAACDPDALVMALGLRRSCWRLLKVRISAETCIGCLTQRRLVIPSRRSASAIRWLSSCGQIISMKSKLGRIEKPLFFSKPIMWGKLPPDRYTTAIPHSSRQEITLNRR